MTFGEWELLAKQGIAEAEYNLGLMFSRGKEVPRDDKKAVKWYRLAAEQGLAQSQTNLGLMFGKGQGVEQDYKEAVKWYRLSAEQRITGAQSNLGLMYEKGQGVEQDYVEAHKWFNISGINGNEIGRRNADIIEKKMTPGQIAVAVGLTRKWLEKL
jgi:TPR repeat protein